VITGHIMGIPVEETLQQLAPVIAASVAVLAIIARVSLNRVRNRVRRR
jgi:hypothetical protein